MRISYVRMLCRVFRSVAAVSACYFAVAVPVHAGTNQWTGIGPVGVDVRYMAVNPLLSTTIYAATGTGVFRSIDGGVSWSGANTGLTVTDVRSIAIDPASASTLYVGTATAGIFKSIDGGGNWNAANIGLTASDVRALAIDPLTPATVYAGTATGGVFKSVDGGGSWNAANSGLVTSDIRALAVDPLTPSTIYAGTAALGVFKSVDGGGSWNAANSGLTASDLRALVVDPLTPANIYAGTASGGVFKSENGGGVWSAVNAGLAALAVQALALDPAQSSTAYAGTDTAGVFMSSDSGGNWSAINSGLTNLTVQSLAIGNAAPATVYAGTATAGAFSLTTAPDSAISPISFNFGSVTIPASSASQVFTISNTGLRDLSVSSVVLSGGDSAMFSVAVGSCPSLTPTLKPGGSCTVNVTFTPASAGAKVTTLVVASNAVTTPTVNVPLSGTGVVQTYPLTLMVTGTGIGTVNYSTGGSCSADCSQSFDKGTSITLTPLAGANSVFAGWSNCPMTMGDSCLIVIYSPLTITAYFNNLTFDVPPYPSIQAAYDAAVDGGVIRVTTATYSGSLACNRNITVTLQGGYDTAFTTIAGYTTLSGTLTVSAGTLIVGGLVVF